MQSVGFSYLLKFDIGVCFDTVPMESKELYVRLQAKTHAPDIFFKLVIIKAK